MTGKRSVKGLIKALVAVFCLVATTGDATGSAVALETAECGEWTWERIGPGNPPQLEIIVPTASASGDCEGVFRLVGSTTSDHVDALTVYVAAQLENAHAEWMPDFNEDGTLILVPPLEREIRVVPENDGEPATVQLMIGYSRHTIGADLSRQLLQTGLDLLPPEACNVSSKQLALTVQAALGSLDEPVSELIAGNIGGLRQSMPIAAPRLYKKAADSLAEAGFPCGERHFQELARRADLIDAAVSDTVAWLPQMLFNVLPGTAETKMVHITYEPSTPEVIFRTVGVRADDVLNIRSGAGIENPITGSIPPNGSGIRQLGPVVMVGPSRWVHIEYRGVTGWVNARYLEAESPP